MYALAETLGRGVYEIESDMPYDEFVGWKEHFVIKEEERKQAEAEARKNAGKSGKGKRR